KQPLTLNDHTSRGHTMNRPTVLLGLPRLLALHLRILGAAACLLLAGASLPGWPDKTATAGEGRPKTYSPYAGRASRSAPPGGSWPGWSGPTTGWSSPTTPSTWASPRRSWGPPPTP